jgi:phosphomethylpyrimidine synthase
LALDPDRAEAYRDQTLPGDNYKNARFRSICGVEFCSMRIDQDARAANGEMAALDDETNLEDSSAAAVNRPPTGTHDTGDVPDLPADVESQAPTTEPGPPRQRHPRERGRPNA